MQAQLKTTVRAPLYFNQSNLSIKIHPLTHKKDQFPPGEKLGTSIVKD